MKSLQSYYPTKGWGIAVGEPSRFAWGFAPPACWSLQVW
jgi:hypothetical protein